nr:response regulator [Neobacillus sp. Marseille-Q6967]
MMCYKVIIADDEPLILRNLTQIIDWEALDCEIIGTSQNGQEALELLEQEHVDLVLTDISMPGMTGIELLKKINHLAHKPIVILISGYDEFEYAKEAIKNNALDYILKPIDYDELEDCINRAISRLKDQKMKEFEYEKFLIYELMTREKINPEAKNKMLPYVAVAVKTQELNIESIIQKVYDYVLKGKAKPYVYKMTNEGVMVVLEFPDHVPDGSVEGFARQIVDHVEQKCVVGIGKQVDCLFDIRQSVEDATELLKFGAFTKSQIITAESIKGEYKPKQTTADLMNEALDYIKNHFEKDLGIEQVAEQVGLSVSYFSNLFKQMTGLTFLEYLTNVRVDHACLLLENLDLKTYEIAEKVGYTDQRYFSQVFKKKMKKTPSEYRKMFKN